MDARNRLGIQIIFKGPYGWIGLIVFFLLWYALFEIGLTLFKNNLAAMVWVPLHFIITPILGLTVSIASIYISAKSRRMIPIASSVACSSVILWVSYIGMSGSTVILETLGVSFN